MLSRRKTFDIWFLDNKPKTNDTAQIDFIFAVNLESRKYKKSIVSRSCEIYHLGNVLLFYYCGLLDTIELRSRYNRLKVSRKSGSSENLSVKVVYLKVNIE